MKKTQYTWHMENVGQTKTPQWALIEIDKCHHSRNKELNLSISRLLLSESELNSIPLYELPSQIVKLDNLETLSLSGNRLHTLPDFISKLTNLKKLDLSSNLIRTLPDSLSALSNLQEIYLWDNLLEFLPASITELSSLRKLYLSGNHLKTLPQTMNKLVDLECLHLSDNQFSLFPEILVQLKNLQEINISGNQLSLLPAEIMDLDNLRVLNARKNPLKSPPIEIAKKGLDSILEYFFQQVIQGEKKLYEAKLLIVGEAGAGKTSLAVKLKNPDLALPNKEETTWGIDIQNWSFPLKDGTPFRVNVWDFGGQQIYHQTHQFFLTHRSLYALVADARKEDTDFYYWLDSAQLFGGDSPLLIVSNEKEDRRKDLPERELHGKFEQLKSVMRTNLKTGRGLAELRNEIEHLLSTLPHVGASLPAGWVRVREALEKDPRDYISQDDFVALCETNGIDRREDALQLSGYLHDIGVILHFKDDPELCETVILKPEWATQAVYDVVQNTGVVNAGGRFTRADLNAIWSGERHKLKRAELLALMKNFRLCYEIVGQHNTFILPQLLPDDVPDYAPIAAPAAQLHYKYEFMPKGMLAQLIVRMNRLIEAERSGRSERPERFTVWKTGVVLAKDGARAEVIEDRHKREIRVRVGGNMRNHLLSLIAYEMQEIHASFRGKLLVSELIPCVCEECGKSDPYFFPYANLMKGMEKGVLEVQCQKSFEMVSIHKVLDGTPFDFVDQREVKELLSKFNKAELDELLFDFRNLPDMRRMGERVDLEDVGSHEMSKEQLIIRLIGHCDRRETLAALYRLARAKRKMG